MPNGTLRRTEDIPSPDDLTAFGAEVIATPKPASFLDDMFFVSGEIPRVTPFERGYPGHVRLADDGKTWEPDELLMDERYLAVNVAGKGLVVLSACETGLGKVAGGEGVLGMQRAFQIAGARSVIASLWKVDDRATQALMSDFYAAAWDTEKIISRAEALRAAQLKMLREGVKLGMVSEEDGKKGARVPPYYWAAFVLSGDWR